MILDLVLERAFKMKKIKIFLVVAAFLLSGQSFAQTTKSIIQGEISLSTANGLLGGTILNNIVLSYVDWATCSGTGGIVYWNAGTPTCLNAGTNGYTLTMISGVPQWTSPSPQSANTVYAGPSSGASSAPAFRALVGADLPNPSSSTLGGVQSVASVSHQWINSISTSGVPQLSQPAFTDISGTLAISAGGTNCTSASGTCVDNISGFATTGYISRTGNGTYAFSTVIPVSGGGTSLSTGTSGGILAFTGSTTIVSSGLLAQYGIVVGGGAGVAPSTVTNGTAAQILIAQTSANPSWNTLSGDATITSGGALTVSASAITNSKLANAAAYTFKGNPTGSSSAPTDFTPGSLTQKASPAAGDYVVIADNAASGALKYSLLSAITSVGSVGSIAGNTGAFTLSQGVTNSGNVITLDASYLVNHINGLTLSNDGTTPNTVLDIATGSATDSTNAVFMKIGAFTKSTGGSWASGSGSNGMGNGLTIAASTWYHVCLAYNGGTSDIWFDTSASCANKPSGISGSQYRRIGSFKTNSSSQILAFKQINGDFIWYAPVLDLNNVSFNSTAALQTLNVPTGVQVISKTRWYASTASGAQIIISSLDENSVNGGSLLSGASSLLTPSTGTIQTAGEVFTRTNTSSQVRVVTQAASGTLYASSYGWYDYRGQN